MTFPRKLALRISDFVARHASPGSKEWAQGITREVAFIDGDWMALGWALGGLRILLDRRKAPKQWAALSLLTLAQVPKEAHDFVKKARSRGQPLYYMTLTIMIAEKYLFAHQRPSIAGIMISAIGAAVCCTLWLVERRRLEDPAKGTIYGDTIDCAKFYRQELQRYRITMWFPQFAWCCSVIGLILNQWRFLCVNRWFFVPWALGWVMIWSMACYEWQRNQERLDQLDVLIAKDA